MAPFIILHQSRDVSGYFPRAWQLVVRLDKFNVLNEKAKNKSGALVPDSKQQNFLERILNIPYDDEAAQYKKACVVTRLNE